MGPKVAIDDTWDWSHCPGGSCAGHEQQLLPQLRKQDRANKRFQAIGDPGSPQPEA